MTKNFKRIISLVLVLAMVFALALTVTSCKNDNADNNSEVENNNNNAENNNNSENNEENNENNTPVEPPVVKDTAKLVIANGDKVAEFEVDLSKIDTKTGAVALLDYLKAEGKIDYKSTDGQYGLFLNEVKAINEDIVVSEGANAYVCLYTSVEKDFDVSQYAKTLDYKGTTLTTSGLGISSMSVPKDAIIYITVGTF